ncbi:MAG: response regulator [bacterium]|nr:response regulator [bacterium]
MESKNQATILLVEDEPVFRLIYRGVLQNAGYTVIEAPDGQTGWEMIRERKPDLVLLDLILPRMSGHEVLHNIRSDASTRDIPVVIFSVMGQEKDVERSFALGANEHRMKGMESPVKILGLIQEMLNKKPAA